MVEDGAIDRVENVAVVARTCGWNASSMAPRAPACPIPWCGHGSGHPSVKDRQESLCLARCARHVGVVITYTKSK